MSDVAQITVSERKGSIERGNSFEIRQDREGGALLHYEERRSYDVACALAAEQCREHGLATYETWRFTTTPYLFCVSTIDVATGAATETHDVDCGT